MGRFSTSKGSRITNSACIYGGILTLQRYRNKLPQITMADIVERVMERMIPALEDLKAKQLFNDMEVATIVKRRREFEYTICGRHTTVDDYLRYIQYELNLEALRKVRYDKHGPFDKQTLSDTAGQSHISFIFVRSLRRFDENVSLWLKYAVYCESLGRNDLLGRLYPRALERHATNPIIWIKAALWEYNENGNIQNARVLFQRALRVIPEAHTLWHEFVRVELAFMRTIRARHRSLGVSTDDEDGERTREFLSGVVPRAVYDNGISVDGLKTSVEFRVGFLHVIDDALQSGANDDDDDDDQGNIDMLNDFMVYIMNTMEADLGDNATTWDILARRCQLSSDGYKRFDNGVDKCGDKRIWQLYAMYAHDMNDTNQQVNVCVRALQHNILCVLTAQLLIDGLLELQRYDDALVHMKQCIQCIRGSALLWSRYIELLRMQSTPVCYCDDNKSTACVWDVFEEAVVAVDGDEHILWLQVLRLSIVEALSGIVPICICHSRFHRAINHTQSCANRSGALEIKRLYLEWCSLSSDIMTTDAVDKLLEQPTDAGIFIGCAHAAIIHNGSDHHTIQGIFERGVLKYGDSDHTIWRAYMSWVYTSGRRYDYHQALAKRARTALPNAEISKLFSYTSYS